VPRREAGASPSVPAGTAGRGIRGSGPAVRPVVAGTEARGGEAGGAGPAGLRLPSSRPSVRRERVRRRPAGSPSDVAARARAGTATAGSFPRRRPQSPAWPPARRGRRRRAGPGRASAHPRHGGAWDPSRPGGGTVRLRAVRRSAPGRPTQSRESPWGRRRPWAHGPIAPVRPVPAHWRFAWTALEMVRGQSPEIPAPQGGGSNRAGRRRAVRGPGPGRQRVSSRGLEGWSRGAIPHPARRRSHARGPVAEWARRGCGCPFAAGPAEARFPRLGSRVALSAGDRARPRSPTNRQPRCGRSPGHFGDPVRARPTIAPGWPVVLIPGSAGWTDGEAQPGGTRARAADCPRPRWITAGRNPARPGPRCPDRVRRPPGVRDTAVQVTGRWTPGLNLVRCCSDRAVLTLRGGSPSRPGRCRGVWWRVAGGENRSCRACSSRQRLLRPPTDFGPEQVPVGLPPGTKSRRPSRVTGPGAARGRCGYPAWVVSSRQSGDPGPAAGGPTGAGQWKPVLSRRCPRR
jgi:hypothetical protein